MRRSRASRSARQPDDHGESAEDRRFVELLGALAADPKYARCVAEYTAARTDASRGFGSNALRTGGKIFAMMSQGTLVVKLPRGRVEQLVSAGEGVQFDPGHGRLMKEWFAVSSPVARWPALAREAHDFVTNGARRGS